MRIDQVILPTCEISWDPETAIELGVRWGIQHFEIKSVWEDRRVPDLTDKQREQLRSLMFEYGVDMPVISPGLFNCNATEEAAQPELARLAPSVELAWDAIDFRTQVARRWGIDATVVTSVEDEIAATKAFSGELGVDGAVLAFGGDGDKAFLSLRQCLKTAPDGHQYGRIVVVGGTRFTWPAPMTNFDIRGAGRTGPGYHDADWETGEDYPRTLVRWSTRANLELGMRLIAERKLDVDVLTTHTIRLQDVEAGIASIISEPDTILGVVFDMVQ